MSSGDQESQIANDLADAINSAKDVLDGPVLRSGSELHRVPRPTSERLSKDQATQLENARKAHQKRLSGVQGQLVRMEQERDDALTALSQLRSRLDEEACRKVAQQENDNGNTEVRRLRQKIDELEETQSILQTTMAEQSEAQKRKLARIRELEEGLAHSTDDARVKSLRSQISELSTDSIRREKSLSSKDNIITELRKKYAQLSDSLCDKEGELEEFKTKFLTVETDLKSLTAQVDAKNTQLKQAETARLASKEEVADVTNQLDFEKVERKREGEAAQDRQVKMERQLRSSATNEKTLQEKTQKLHSDNLDLQEQYQSSEANNERLERQKNSTRSKAAICFLQNTKSFSLSSFFSRWQARAVTSQKGRMRNQVADLEEQLKVERQKAADAAKESQELLRVAGTERTRLTAEKEQVAAELESVKRTATEDQELNKSQIASYKKTIQEVQDQGTKRLAEVTENTNEEKDVLQQTIAKEKTNNDTLKDEIKDLKAAVKNLGTENEKLNEKVEAAEDNETASWVERTKELEEKSKTWKEEKKELLAKNNELTAKNQQLVEALHTSEEEAESKVAEAQGEKRAADAAQLQHSLDALEEAHKVAMKEVEEKNASTERQLKIVTEEHSHMMNHQTHENPKKSARWSRHKIHIAMLLQRSTESQNALIWYFRWALLANRRKMNGIKKMAQRSLGLLQTKADSLRRIADEAVAKNTSLETQVKELQLSIEQSPRRRQKLKPGEVDVMDMGSTAGGRDVEMQETRQRMAAAERKAGQASRLMETAKSQIQTVVVELQKARDKEQSLFDEVHGLTAELEGKEVELKRLKGELKKALTRWNEVMASDSPEQTEFATWLLGTRAGLVKDLCHLHHLVRGSGGEDEATAQTIVYKYLTDPEKHHHGISINVPHQSHVRRSESPRRHQH